MMINKIKYTNMRFKYLGYLYADKINEKNTSESVHVFPSVPSARGRIFLICKIYWSYSIRSQFRAKLNQI